MPIEPAGMTPVLRPAILAFLALLISYGVSSADEAACRLEPVAELPMTTDADGRVSVPMTINEQEVHLLIDTGSGLSLLSQSAVAALGFRIIPAQRGSIELFGGQASNHYVIAPDPILGEAHLRPLPFFIAPDERFRKGNAGALGADFLKRYDVEFDFANGIFRLFSPNHCSGKVVYWTKGPFARIPFTLDRDAHIKVPVQLDGRDMFAALDTGAEESVGSLEDIASDFGVEDIGSVLKPGSGIQVYRYPFKLLTFEGVAVYNPAILLYPNAVSHMPRSERELIIGMNVLHRLHIYIAYSEDAIYLTSPDAR